MATQKKEWEPIIGTLTALDIARDILREINNGESFDNVAIEQRLVSGHEDLPYHILRISFDYLLADQLRLIDKIVAKYDGVSYTIEDNKIQIEALSDSEKEMEE